MNQMENQNSTRLEILVERFNKEQTLEATDAFMELVIAVCDDPETDKTLKELVNL